MDHPRSLRELCRLIDDSALVDQYLASYGFGASPMCANCDIAMKRRTDKVNAFRCNKCHKTETPNSLFLFARSNLTKGDMLLIGYLWLTKVEATKIVEMTGFHHNTVKLWTDRFREAITMDIQAFGDENMIGGDEVIVEIDESKFGKRKYHRGHKVEGVWVVGGRERTEERRMFAVIVDDRSAATLLDVITKYVRPGSIIYTDCWKGYQTDGLLDAGMLHGTVNHSEHFKDPVTGVCTNSIEGTWAAMKWVIPKRKRTLDMIEPYLFEYMWRANHSEDLWARFLLAIRDYVENVTEI